MSLIGQNGDTWGDGNIVIEEGLTVTYSRSIIQGSWGYTSANVSGWYNTMRELHRYARKSYKYVGMTYEVAKKCRDEMVKLYTRTLRTSYWQGNVMGGGWNDGDGGETLTADVSLTHGDGDAWEVHVRVNEDSVRYRLATEPAYVNIVFAHERVNWSYGSDGEGTDDERELKGA